MIVFGFFGEMVEQQLSNLEVNCLLLPRWNEGVGGLLYAIMQEPIGYGWCCTFRLAVC